MRSITGKLTLSAALIAFAGAAQAGNEGAYTLMPVQTQSAGANYVAPAPSYMPQPTETYTTTYSAPSAEAEIGEIIYNTGTTTGDTMPHTSGETISYDTMSYSSGEVVNQSGMAAGEYISGEVTAHSSNGDTETYTASDLITYSQDGTGPISETFTIDETVTHSDGTSDYIENTTTYTTAPASTY